MIKPTGQVRVSSGWLNPTEPPRTTVTCFYSYSSTKNHQKPYLLVTITFLNTGFSPVNVLRVSGHCADFHSEGNTNRHTNYCKQMMQILHLSIQHTTWLVTQGNIFNSHMVKGRTQNLGYELFGIFVARYLKFDKLCIITL